MCGAICDSEIYAGGMFLQVVMNYNDYTVLIIHQKKKKEV